MGKKELKKLRCSLHDKILEIVKKGCMDYRELRGPNENESQRASKIICMDYNIKKGEKLLEKIESTITSTNKKMKEAAETSAGPLPVTPIKYKINLIVCSGPVVLSKKEAQRRISLTGTELHDSITNYIKYLQSQEEQDEDLINDAKKFLKKINLKRLYIDATNSGASYRVNCYDVTEQKRRQLSVGNILILIGGSNFEFLENIPRKVRSDQAELLFSYNQIQNNGETKQHNIYPFDLRYSDRHVHKKK